jgi:hypothetical protein
MKRYQPGYGRLENALDEDGEFVLYEDARAIEVDRDIKAANLDTLRRLVLAMDDDADFAAYKAIEAAIDFARGLPE